jgi:hypothetical protein
LLANPVCQAAYAHLTRRIRQQAGSYSSHADGHYPCRAQKPAPTDPMQTAITRVVRKNRRSRLAGEPIFQPPQW